MDGIITLLVYSIVGMALLFIPVYIADARARAEAKAKRQRFTKGGYVLYPTRKR